MRSFSLSTPPCPPANAVAESPIQGQLGQLNHNIDRLHKIIGELTGRLAAVLSTEEPADATPKAPQPISMRLADMIGDHAHGVEAASDRLTEILRRLEL